jgi:hypothetical protein
MSPPEVWGPAIWTLFHTISEKINENAYPYVVHSMFIIIRRICSFLPCPDCSRHASSFLAKINIRDYKTKNEFKNMIYLFHNSVNAKKRKPLFNYANMNKYTKLNLQIVINNFIANYNTKGNMKLLTESFQRTIVIKDFINWFKFNSKAFLPTRIHQSLQQKERNNVEEQPNTIVDVTIVEEQPNTIVDVDVNEEQEQPVIDVSEEQEQPVIDVSEEQEQPVIDVSEEQEQPVIDVTEEQEQPVIVTEEQDQPVIVTEEQEKPVI